MGLEYDGTRERTSVKGVECGAEKGGKKEINGVFEKVPRRRRKS